MTQKILFVDDSLQLLSAIRRRLRRELDLTVAEGGVEALQIMEEEGPFAVIVTDQNMPGMDGTTLLKEVYHRSPRTIRIMMTGQADKDTAIEAINTGHIYALLRKPCSPEDVLEAVRNGIDRYTAQNTERKLLEQTLAGSVKLLVDVIALQNSDIARMPAYARQWVKLLAHRFKSITAWELDLALMLSPLGKITLPHELQAKLLAAEAPLSAEEKATVDQCPRAARDLLSNIPRMERIAEAVYYQNAGFDGSGFPGDGKKGRALPELARLLFVLNKLIEACEAQDGPASLTKAFSDLTRNSSQLDPEIFDTCKQVLTDKRLVNNTESTFVTVKVEVRELMDGDLLESDIRTVHNSLVVPKGTVVTPPLIQKVIHVDNNAGLASPFLVMRQTVSSTA